MILGPFEPARVLLEKALESLTGAEDEYTKERYNNVANRSYYACFQAAISALILAGIRAPGSSDQWGHDYVQAQFVGQLINRRKIYGTELRNTLEQNYRLREVADYHPREHVTQVRAARALHRAHVFVVTVQSREAPLQ